MSSSSTASGEVLAHSGLQNVLLFLLLLLLLRFAVRCFCCPFVFRWCFCGCFAGTANPKPSSTPHDTDCYDDYFHCCCLVRFVSHWHFDAVVVRSSSSSSSSSDDGAHHQIGSYCIHCAIAVSLEFARLQADVTVRLWSRPQNCLPWYVCMYDVCGVFVPPTFPLYFFYHFLFAASFATLLGFWGFFFFFSFFLFCPQCVCVFSSVHVFSHSGFQCRIELPLLLVLFVWRRNKNIWVTRGGSNFRVSAYGKKLHNVTLAFAEISMVITVWWILKQVQNSEKELICNTKSTTIL